MLTRCAVISGPGAIITPAGTFCTTGDIKVTFSRELRDLESSLFGKIGKVLRKLAVEITCELLPIAAYAPQLITMQPVNVGESLFGCVDSYLEIHGRDDVKLRFAAGALLQPPAVRFSSSRNLYGEAKWGAVVANEADLGTLESLLAISAASFSEPAEAFRAEGLTNKGGKLFFDDADTDPESNKLWNVGTEDGIEIGVNYNTRSRMDDGAGQYDFALTDVSFTAKFKPQTLTIEELLAILPADGPNAISGLNIGKLAKSLRVEHSPLATGDLVFTAAKAAPDASTIQWSRTANRMGELSLVGIGSVDEEEATLPLYAFEIHGDSLGIGDGDVLGIGDGDTLGIGAA